MTTTTSIEDNELNQLNIPHEFICPITHEMMQYPLMSRYGQTYERDAILTWLSNHNNLCPLTRQVLLVTDLIRHRTLQSKIAAWKIQHGIANTIKHGYGQEEVGDITSDTYHVPNILLTCQRSDFSFSNHSDHSLKHPSTTLQQRPPIVSEEVPQLENDTTITNTSTRRLGRSILRLIRTAR
jgi:U-box domain